MNVHFLVCYRCFSLGSIIICRWYELTLSDRTQVTLQPRCSLSHVLYRFFSCFALARGPDFFFFTGGPNPLPTALYTTIMYEYYLILQFASLRHSNRFCVTSSQRSLLFHFAVSRGPRVLSLFSTVIISLLLTIFKGWAGDFIRMEETCYIKRFFRCFS